MNDATKSKPQPQSPPDFWKHRRVFVTGATGMVGYWLGEATSLAAGAQVTALVRDPDPQAGFYSSGDYQQVSLVQGRIEDFWSLERALNENEVDTVFHPRRRSRLWASRTGIRCRLLRRTSAGLTTCSKPAAA